MIAHNGEISTVIQGQPWLPGCARAPVSWSPRCSVTCDFPIVTQLIASGGIFDAGHWAAGLSVAGPLPHAMMMMMVPNTVDIDPAHDFYGIPLHADGTVGLAPPRLDGSTTLDHNGLRPGRFV
jgi:glutamate synthase domain-containing protein 1